MFRRANLAVRARFCVTRETAVTRPTASFVRADQTLARSHRGPGQRRVKFFTGIKNGGENKIKQIPCIQKPCDYYTNIMYTE